MRKTPVPLDAQHGDMRLLTLRETTQLLGVGRGQIDSWMLQGKLRAIFVGKQRRFPLWHIRRFQESLLDDWENSLLAIVKEQSIASSEEI
jgi:excisionase family DNA binding protein